MGPGPDLPHGAPSVLPDLAAIKHPPAVGIQVTWIGHSTFLIQVDGLNILTDPIFADRASPLQTTGPRRLVPPGVSLEDLPAVHAVTVSHNHYDHLDKGTVQRLGNSPLYLVPFGLKAWFARLDVENVIELNWWKSAVLGETVFHCTPAEHFSGRKMFDFNSVLWCGWMIETNSGLIYFAGDSGYSPHFRQTGERLGAPRLAFLPIGAYMPRWFMRPMHMNPPEALKAHLDLGAKQSIGMHWGTFRLTDEPLNEPPRYLERALLENGTPAESFLVMKIGETALFQ